MCLCVCSLHARFTPDAVLKQEWRVTLGGPPADPPHLCPLLNPPPPQAESRDLCEAQRKPGLEGRQGAFGQDEAQSDLSCVCVTLYLNPPRHLMPLRGFTTCVGKVRTLNSRESLLYP